MTKRRAELLLMAPLAALRKTPAWHLVDQTLLVNVDQLPDDERRLLSQFVAKMRSGGA